jgi:hypothetical protein
MKRGDVYDARLDPVEGSEQRGSRPVVVVSRNAINEFSPVVSAAPCTTYREGRRVYPSNRAGGWDGRRFGDSRRTSAGARQEASAPPTWRTDTRDNDTTQSSPASCIRSRLKAGGSTSQGTNTRPMRRKRFLPAPTRSGEAARSYTLPWAKPWMVDWRLWSFAACPAVWCG